MKHSVMLTIASLMSILLMIFHLSGDIIDTAETDSYAYETVSWEQVDDDEDEA